MVPALRQAFNQQFTAEKYEAFINALGAAYPGQLDFRVAETPVFIPKAFWQQALDACESIVDVITTEKYKQQSEAAIPAHLRVPGDEGQPQFIAFDFGICQNEAGELEPQLIEIQGFPSLFAFQVLLPEISRQHFDLPSDYDHFLNGFSRESYIELLKKIIIGTENPENVILLEIFPEKQKTRIDFFCTENYLGIKTVCLTKLIQEGKDLYYLNNGVKTKINRIYNRLIFDDLLQQAPEVQEKGKVFSQELNVTWVPHPHWFYRISKFSLPFIHHANVPYTRFLSEVTQVPHDLHNYVVKPLFSFAGQGVIIDVTEEELQKIDDPENWILQKKVQYADVIETPGENAKAEIRLFYFWEDGAARPVATNNLARLSKGKMVGVRYNKDKEWVGGTFCLFEK
jgi:hypothetical protein